MRTANLPADIKAYFDIVTFADQHWESFFQTRFSNKPVESKIMGSLIRQMKDKIDQMRKTGEPFWHGQQPYLLVDFKFNEAGQFAAQVDAFNALMRKGYIRDNSVLPGRVRPSQKAFIRMTMLVATDPNKIQVSPTLSADEFTESVHAQSPLTARIFRKVRVALAHAA